MTHKARVPRKRPTQAGSRDDEPPRLRVRSTPLERPDELKLALAIYLLAMQLVEDRTEVASEPRDGDSHEAAFGDAEDGAAGGVA